MVGRATKIELFDKIPTVLAIQLLIFSNDAQKIIAGPDIPRQFAVSLLGGCRRCVYTLRSVVEHVGSTLDAGHYICFHIGESGGFVGYDDQRVLKERPRWHTLVPYILMYELDRCERHAG